MALNIKDDETDGLARELAELKGTSITEAVKGALKKDLADERRRHGKASLSELKAIARRFASRPVLDPTPPDEMLYDEYGIPK
jgi:antitoxin VapB